MYVTRISLRSTAHVVVAAFEIDDPEANERRILRQRDASSIAAGRSIRRCRGGDRGSMSQDRCTARCRQRVL